MINNKKLRVFEAFAGIGAQASALKKLNINYEVVGISDWFVDAIICYDAIHNNNETINIPSFEEQINYLNNFQFSRDSVHPTNIKSFDKETIKKLYIANKRSKNFGSITQLHGKDMPDVDLLIYSFPCQDLSTGGKCHGMKKGSQTRSGLLWEVERILNELKSEKRLPKYLLLENVKTILASSNKPDLDQWLSALEKLGYHNDECMLLNAKDFGIPQDRERAFIFSSLNKPLKVGSKINRPTKHKPIDAFNFIKANYSNPVYKQEADLAQLNRTPSREQMWEINGMDISPNTIVRTITCNMDRTHTAALFKYNGIKGNTYRRLTIREAFLLMGFAEKEYEKTTSLGFSYRKMNKLIGNSIVVNVLTEIFRVLFAEKYKKASNYDNNKTTN